MCGISEGKLGSGKADIFIGYRGGKLSLPNGMTYYSKDTDSGDVDSDNGIITYEKALEYLSRYSVDELVFFIMDLIDNAAEG